MNEKFKKEYTRSSELYAKNKITGIGELAVLKAQFSHN
jgi:hypothetical protein